MKKSTAIKLKMYLNVQSVLSKHQSAWAEVSAFAGTVATFNSKLELLQSQLVEQDQATHGVAANKKIRLNDLRERMLVVHKALKLHGKATANRALEERNTTSKTALDRLNIAKLTVHCGELKLDLESFGSDLVPYGIAGETIGELIPILASIDELNISTRQAIMDRKSVTQSINELEHSIDNLLHNELDDLLLVFKLGQPRFFAAFRDARIIIAYGKKGKTGGEPQPDDGIEE